MLLLQQLPPPLGSHSNSRVEIETIELSQSFSFPDPANGFDSEVLMEGDLQREISASPSTSQEDAASPSPAEIRGPMSEDEEREEAGCSEKTLGLPARSARLIRNGRLLLLEKSWSRSPNSALALLVALGDCLGSRLTKFGSSVLEILTTNLVVRWQKGKVWADCLQSLVVRHIVPHLSIRVPRGLSLLPLVRRKISPEPDAHRLDSVEAQSEIVYVQKLDPSSLTCPVVPETSSSSSSGFPTLHIQAEGSGVRPSSSTRRFVKNLSSKLKAKISKPGSISSVSQSTPSSPRRGSKLFSRRGKEKEMSDDGWPDEDVFAESSKKRCILNKKCSFRKEKTPEPSATRRSPLGRNSSSKAMESSPSTDITTHHIDITGKSIFDAGHKNFDLWLIVGLLMALLFLLVSRFSAIVATSSLFLVLSYAHKESSYHQVRRDVERQSVGPARKLHRSPGYAGLLGSPSSEVTAPNPRQ